MEEKLWNQNFIIIFLFLFPPGTPAPSMILDRMHCQLILMNKLEDMQMHVISCRMVQLCKGEQKHLTFYSTYEPHPQYCLWLMTIQSTLGNLCGVERSPPHTIPSGVHS